MHCLESLLELSAGWQLRAVVKVVPMIHPYGSYTILEVEEESSLPHTTVLTMLKEPSHVMSAYRCWLRTRWRLPC